MELDTEKHSTEQAEEWERKYERMRRKQKSEKWGGGKNRRDR